MIITTSDHFLAWRYFSRWTMQRLINSTLLPRTFFHPSPSEDKWPDEATRTHGINPLSHAGNAVRRVFFPRVSRATSWPRTLLIATGARASDIQLNDLIIGPRASRKWAPLDVMNRDVMNFNERATYATSLLASLI